MEQDDVFYEAMMARDYRFDGKFFVAVKTTGIYCRPICPAKPKRKNVEFFTHASAAEKAGYRPCLRCRPEYAPLSPAWFGKSEVVQRALKRIAANELFESNEDDFADTLGVSARHLRRLFEEELGQTPKQISDNNRLNFARKLITETPMPMITVAATAGFQSLRRFNDAFNKRFHRTPSQARSRGGRASSSTAFELTLAYRPPFDWASLIQFYKSHHIPGIETVTEDTFERIFRLGNTTGFFRVQPVGYKAQLKLHVVTENPKILFEIVRRVRKMFDLDSDPLLVSNSFARIPLLASLCEKYPGLRLPRGWDPFETTICSVLGQLVSVEHARSLVGQLVHLHGTEILHPVTGEKVRLFPSAIALMKSELAELKTTGTRRATIRALSQLIVDNQVRLSDAQDPLSFRKALLDIRGIGHWSAEYISLRAIGDTDAFPATDLILRRVLELHPALDLDLVRPWRSYAAIYLWKHFAHSLSNKKDAA